MKVFKSTGIVRENTTCKLDGFDMYLSEKYIQAFSF